MLEDQIEELVRDLEAAHFTNFREGNALIVRSRGVRDPRVARMLTIRHHGLANKEAISCHLLRQIIKEVDGPEFPTLWDMALASDDSTAEKTEDRLYDSPAATYVLGEIGGLPALCRVAEELGHSDRKDYVLLEVLTDLVCRYAAIAGRADEEPTASVLEVKTGQTKTVPLRTIGADLHEEELKRRRDANELFQRIDEATLRTLVSKIHNTRQDIPNITREQLFDALKQFGREQFWRIFFEAKGYADRN